MRKIIAFGLVGLVLSAFGGGLPYAFEYGGKAYRGYEGVIDGALKVSVERQEFPDFPGADWYTVWFENVGDKPTAVLKDIVSLDAVFAGEEPVLSGILGDHKNLYRPYAHDFAKDGAKEFADEYVSRASLLPVYAYHESFSRNKNLDFDILRRNLAEWRSVADLLTKDFYTLTPWRAPNDRTGWTVFAYRDPATKRGVLMAFRQEDCKEATCEVTLPFETDPAKRTLKLRLDQPRSSLLMELGAA